MTKKILNDWSEKLIALSNRRLTLQNLKVYFKLNWSIDRITIVGYFQYEPEDVFDYLVSKGWARDQFRGINLVNKYGENIAYIEELKYGNDREKGIVKGRIDFNPNTLHAFSENNLKSFIHELFTKPHFSRADVAVDLFNLPDDLVRQYRLSDAVSFKPIYGRSGELETAYWGARSSERQLRMYNKFVEQNRKHELIPEEVKTWWRIELQLRRAKASDWVSVVHETLDNFTCAEFIPIDWSMNDKMIVFALLGNQEFWSGLSSATKSKYRKKIRELVKQDSLTQELLSSFAEYQSKLKEELDSWLLGIDVTDSADDVEE